MVSYKVVARNQRTPLIGGYITPLTLEQLPDLEEALNRFPGREPVVLDPNADIDRLRNPGTNRLLTSWHPLGWWNSWAISYNASTIVTFRRYGKPSTPEY